MDWPGGVAKIALFAAAPSGTRTRQTTSVSPIGPSSGNNDEVRTPTSNVRIVDNFVVSWRRVARDKVLLSDPFVTLSGGSVKGYRGARKRAVAPASQAAGGRFFRSPSRDRMGMRRTQGQQKL